MKCTKLAVIDERDDQEVMSIIPFDVTNSDEVSAFRLAIEEAKSVGSSEVVCDQRERKRG